MSLEGQQQDKKSLRTVCGRTADWHELAKDCVAFANATGGRILIGIEDADDSPPIGQRLPVKILDTIRRRISELTVNVNVPDPDPAIQGELELIKVQLLITHAAEELIVKAAELPVLILHEENSPVELFKIETDLLKSQ